MRYRTAIGTPREHGHIITLRHDLPVPVLQGTAPAASCRCGWRSLRPTVQQVEADIRRHRYNEGLLLW